MLNHRKLYRAGSGRTDEGKGGIRSCAFDSTAVCAEDMRIIAMEKILMLAAYNRNAPKRAANLSVNEDLLNKAKALGINVSATLEHALVEALRSKQREQWLAENRTAMSAYNEHVEAHGVFSDDLRSF